MNGIPVCHNIYEEIRSIYFLLCVHTFFQMTFICNISFCYYSSMWFAPWLENTWSFFNIQLILIFECYICVWCVFSYTLSILHIWVSILIWCVGSAANLLLTAVVQVRGSTSYKISVKPLFSSRMTVPSQFLSQVYNRYFPFVALFDKVKCFIWISFIESSFLK